MRGNLAAIHSVRREDNDLWGFVTIPRLSTILLPRGKTHWN